MTTRGGLHCLISQYVARSADDRIVCFFLQVLFRIRREIAVVAPGIIFRVVCTVG